MGVKDDDAFAATVAPTGATQVVTPGDTQSEIPQTSEAPLPQVPYAHFKTEREIARGGMGKIVAAEDTRLGREVALKVLLEPAGDQLERFEREALITARLQHPGIVPVYEAGRWPSGEPFFAMKLVKGQPLDEVIAKCAGLEARLALLPRVVAAADAIAYAHSRRIVHRDLKPANVLVGSFGETVVIDWGLAKDLDADDSLDVARPRKAKPASVTKSGSSTLTVAGAVMGTPAYMAPEQARGEAVDQRADVFALGAMLYHLLAGTPPYRARTATDVIAAAALGRVVPLSDRETRAPKDLVAIVDRAMAQDLDARYANAGAFADDLRRFLTGQLVAAHRYTTAQRIARFVKKHRAAVTISAVALAITTTVGSVAIVNVVESRDDAKAARDDALLRKQAAEGLIDQMFVDVEAQLRAIGRLELLARMGSGVEHYFDTLDKAPGGMATDDVARMTQAIDLIGEAEAKSGFADAALARWTAARARLANLVAAADVLGAATNTHRHARQLAHLDYELGSVYQQRGDTRRAFELLAQAKSEYAALRLDPGPVDRRALLDSAIVHDRLGDMLRNQGKIDAAFEEYSAAKLDREAAVSAGGAPSEEAEGLATSHVKLGSMFEARGESATALGEYQAALKLRRRLATEQPGNMDAQHALLEIEDALAVLERALGDDRAAIGTYREALPDVDELIARDPANTSWQRQKGLLLADLGFALLDSGAYHGGIDALDHAISLEKGLAEKEPKSTTWKVDLSRSYTRAGDGHVYDGSLDDGIATYEKGLALRLELHDKDAKSIPYRRALAWSYAKLAVAHREKHEADKAREACDDALALRRAIVEESPSQGLYKDELAQSEVELARELAGSDAAKAREAAASAVGRARITVEGDALNLDLKATLVQALVVDAQLEAGEARGRLLDEARAVAETAIARAPQSAHWPGWLADVHAARGDWQRVVEVLEPLANEGRLPAARVPLLDAARAHLR